MTSYLPSYKFGPFANVYYFKRKEGSYSNKPRIFPISGGIFKFVKIHSVYLFGLIMLTRVKLK